MPNIVLKKAMKPLTSIFVIAEGVQRAKVTHYNTVLSHSTGKMFELGEDLGS